MEKEFLDSSNELHKFNKYLIDFVRNGASGELNNIIQYHFSNTGKQIRPKIIFQIALALGVSINEVIDWAIACEVLHNATLIHDDLQDGDHYRRGKLSVWSKFGTNMAINAGDYLMLHAPYAILKSSLSDKIKIDLSKIFSKMSSIIVNGQSLEFELNKLSMNSIKQNYLKCIEGKTAALFAHMSYGVGIIAKLEENKCIELFNLFNQLGIIFQIQDDLLDLYGHKQRDSIGCDVKEGKVSYLVVEHLCENPEDLPFIKELLFKPRELTSDLDVDSFKVLLDKKGTYQSSINNFLILISDLLESKILKENENLKSIVIKLVRKVIDPIDHLLINAKDKSYVSTFQ